MDQPSLQPIGTSGAESEGRKTRKPRGREPGSPALPVLPLPGWLAKRQADAASPVASALLAGAGLLAVDRIIRAEPLWLGAFRQRQALSAAAASTRALRAATDEAGLRDAHHLTRPGDDPGSAGRIHRVWRDLAAQPVRQGGPMLTRLAAGLGVPLAEESARRIAAAGERATPVESAVAAASATVAELGAARGPALVLAWMSADLALAAACGWSHSLPLLACGRPSTGLSRQNGQSVLPDEPDWSAACHAAFGEALVAAHVRAADLARRAQALQAAFAYVRSKGGDRALAAILDDDSVMATTLSGLGSERAARRFLDRLHGLGGLRLLTDRATFRLYGL